MSDCIENVRSSIKKLIAPGDKVLVAVSGGVDSVALLYLLDRFKSEFDYELFVAHLNHLSRGSESDKDAKFVEEEAKKLSLPVYVDRVNIHHKKSLLKTSFQESARILRYQFLEQVLISIKGNKIAVGHNSEDQIETVLINLLRGAGLKGLSGIPEKRGNVIRPILGCSRADLELFLQTQSLSYRTDSTNSQKLYLRNKIRHDLIPYLKTFNKNILGNLAGLADIVREEDDWISEKSRVIYSQLLTNQNGNQDLSFRITDFQKQHQAIKRRLVREAIYQLNGNLRAITALHIRQVLELFARARLGSHLMLPGNVRVFCDYETVIFSLIGNSEEDEIRSLGVEQEPIWLKIPGVTSISGGNLNLHAGFMAPPELFPKSMDEKRAYLDFEKTGELVQARFFKPGDHFVPLGMQGHKKLKSYFIDQKIPRSKRSIIPILTNGDGDIIWIYGERISERFRITKKTKKVLYIEGKVPLKY
jgi:tRNA(Ile)-lysidine synthase